MNNNEERIDNLLEGIKKLLSENSNLNFTKEWLYDYIIKMDVPIEEYYVNLADYGWFNEWANEFPRHCKTKKNQVNYFCRFGSQEDIYMKVNNPIKIYIPVDLKHLKDAFSKILGFLIENNMPYQAKVAREIRFDNIVVRLCNIEDTKKLIDYINNEPTIKEGLSKPSPFCYNYKGVALTFDANLSYHTTIVYYLHKYITERRNNNQLDKISAKNFFEYIEELYNDTFVNHTKFTKLEIAEYDRNASPDRNILTCKEILSLIYRIQKSDFNDETFFETFKEYNKPELIADEIDELCVLRCLTEIIVIQGSKMGLQQTLTNLKKYIEEDDIKYITNDASLRESILLSNFLPKLNSYLNSKKITIEELFFTLANDEIKLIGINKKDDKEIEELDKSLGQKLKKVIEDLSKIEIGKFLSEEISEPEKIKNSIINAMKRIRVALGANNPAMLPRKNNIRQRLFSLRDDILSIIYSKNIKLPKYLKSKMQDSDLVKQYILEEAIIKTFEKYDNLYKEGKIDYSGRDHILFSIDILLSQGVYDGITNDFGIRDNLKTLSVDKIFEIIKKKLNIDNIQLDSLTDEERIDIITKYNDTIISQSTKKKTVKK